MVDGAVVGYLSLSWSEEIPVGMGLPPSVGLAGMSAASSSPGSDQQTRGGAPHHPGKLGGTHHGTGGSQQSHPAHHTQHHRYLDPGNRAKIHHQAEKEQKIKSSGGDSAFGGPPQEKKEKEQPTFATTAKEREKITGKASFYDKGFAGKQTSTGEKYDPEANTAAIQIGLRDKFGGVHAGGKDQWADVEYNGKTVRVRINDVGPLAPGRVIDLSRGVMRQFDPTLSKGVLEGVTVTPVSPGEISQDGKKNRKLGDAPLPHGEPTFASFGNRSDLDYLHSYGGHSSKLENGKIVDGPPGSEIPLNPEFAARLRAAGEAYTKETGQVPKYGEADRGPDVQAIYYDRYKHGGGIAAPPGRSRHQSGNAMDIPRGPFHEWLDKHAGEYGLHFPVRGDYPHIQANPAYQGSFSKPSTPTPSSTGGNKLLFLPGMYSRYQGRTPGEIEGQIKRYSDAKKSSFESIGISGDKPSTQLQAARERLRRGDIKEVVGFSAGGYNANRLEKEFPNIKFTKIGAPGTSGNLTFPGGHMDQPAGLAKSVEKPMHGSPL